ncbi:hypothetical protein GWI33_014879 [Rhynchophorus ferrugineus]|uniref:C2H2-type domain-containing protein n=1 Tax=Rhynchophorus ferrugineus TaxID=354439 RepID=A0A834I0R7_RHYFE|nr:hypothetical protein GWI33_014879 [Rhynchophorus ferrugineus]
MENKHFTKTICTLAILAFYDYFVNDDSLYECRKCQKTYKTKQGVRLHQRCECGKQKQFVCKICGKSTYQKGNLKKHMTLRAQPPGGQRRIILITAAYVLAKNLAQDKKFKCMKCDKSYKHKPNLYRHSKYECDGVPRFVCDICGKAYTQKVTLKQHVDSLHFTAVFNFDTIFDRIGNFKPKRE